MRRGGHVWSNQGSAQKLRRYGVIFARAKLARARFRVAGAGLRKTIMVALVFNMSLIFDPIIGFARPPEVLAFGDSLTAGLGLPDRQAFPAQLEARLRNEGVEVHIVNAGVSGDTTTD